MPKPLKKQPHEMTLRQYETWMRDSYVAENPSLTKVEYMRNYPFGSRKVEWLGVIVNAAMHGNVIPSNILDRIYIYYSHNLVFFLAHDYPKSIPRGYLNPYIRAINRDYRIKLKANKKGKRNEKRN